MPLTPPQIAMTSPSIMASAVPSSFPAHPATPAAGVSKKTNTKKTNLLALPDDTITDIISYLKIEDIPNFSRVSKGWHVLISTSYFFQILMHNSDSTIPFPQGALESKAPPVDIKSTVRNFLDSKSSNRPSISAGPRHAEATTRLFTVARTDKNQKSISDIVKLFCTKQNIKGEMHYPYENRELRYLYDLALIANNRIKDLYIAPYDLVRHASDSHFVVNRIIFPQLQQWVRQRAQNNSVACLTATAAFGTVDLSMPVANDFKDNAAATNNTPLLAGSDDGLDLKHSSTVAVGYAQTPNADLVLEIKTEEELAARFILLTMAHTVARTGFYRHNQDSKENDHYFYGFNIELYYQHKEMLYALKASFARNPHSPLLARIMGHVEQIKSNIPLYGSVVDKIYADQYNIALRDVEKSIPDSGVIPLMKDIGKNCCIAICCSVGGLASCYVTEVHEYLEPESDTWSWECPGFYCNKSEKELIAEKDFSAISVLSGCGWFRPMISTRLACIEIHRQCGLLVVSARSNTTAQSSSTPPVMPRMER